MIYHSLTKNFGHHCSPSEAQTHRRELEEQPKTVLLGGKQSQFFRPPAPSGLFPTYTLGAKDSEQNHPPKRQGLVQTSPEHRAACESTALCKRWECRHVMCEPFLACKLPNVPSDTMVVTKKPTPTTSAANATIPRAERTRGDTLLPLRTVGNPSGLTTACRSFRKESCIFQPRNLPQHRVPTPPASC